ncbi:Helix-turn-helix domain [Oligella urethralis]|uniref:helix-turn-helix domain-containing protein n=1 Tax=Oligella urethralis TaxID=90245 RepID=UPI000DF90084|nr:helix-turn-helix domain-containing protein [Oligella urethralis]SUA61570.1 Helix-turn-helix domain [Oligella urethralis]
MRSFADRLKHAMSIRNARQIDISKVAGVSRATVHGWISGVSATIHGDHLTKISKYLNVNPHWLATGEGLMKDRNWPFKTITEEDWNILPDDVISDLEQIIQLQIFKHKELKSKNLKISS